MCRACAKDFPTPREYRTFVCASAELADQVHDGLRVNDPQFLEQIRSLDSLRFGRNPDWGNRETSQSTRECVFERSDVQNALTLFVLTNWYNIQEDYRDIWTTRLTQLSRWIDSPPQNRRALPHARFIRLKAPIAWKTWQACKSNGFGFWFAATVNRIANANPSGTGNLRRFIAALVLDLMEPGQQPRHIAERDLANGNYTYAELKRAWLLTMCLRRDQGIVKCLIERAVAPIKKGTVALEAWYDGVTFPETESELPVDSRMKKLGATLFNELTPRGIANAAHAWGKQHNLAPSVLDALFFSMD